MKKVLLCTLVLLMPAVPGFAALNLQTIKIDVLQGDGLTAAYDHSTQTLTWSGGASISLYSSLNGSGDPVATFHNAVNIQGEFTMLTDQSSGPVAKASFAAIDWTISVGGVDLIWGTNKSGESFVEAEQYEEVGPMIFDSGILFGSGVVQVDGSIFDSLGDFAWEDSNGYARLKSQVAGDSSFDSYLTNDYNTLVTTMWLYADETVIPEPATMALLGLGSLLALRKRK